MVSTRLTEMFCQSIPAAVFKIYAYLQGGEKYLLLSVMVSAITSSFVTACLSYDQDVNPQRRRQTPAFYGYVKDAAFARTLAFGCMFVNNGLLFLLRSSLFAMLMVLDKRTCLAVWIVDIVFYLGLKAARRDFMYWLPLEGGVAVVTSLMTRVVVKLAVDWTGVVHYRHPQEVGGAYWAASIASTLLGAVGVALAYGNERVSTIVMGLAAGWIFAFGVFLKGMKSEFRWTLCSTTTGAKWLQAFYLDGTDDETKVYVLNCHTSQWASIRQDVKAFVKTHWWRWEAERPAFFTDTFKAMVPQDMLSKGVRKEGLGETEKTMTNAGVFRSYGGGLGGGGSSVVAPE